jgi:hypothetical protein
MSLARVKSFFYRLLFISFTFIALIIAALYAKFEPPYRRMMLWKPRSSILNSSLDKRRIIIFTMFMLYAERESTGSPPRPQWIEQYMNMVGKSISVATRIHYTFPRKIF